MLFFVRRAKVGLCFVFGCAILSEVAGCAAKTAQVVGTVTFDGKPVTSGSVILYCADKQIVRGIIGPNGSYTIPNVPQGAIVATVRAHTPMPPGFQVKQQLPPSTNGPLAPTSSGTQGLVVVIPQRYGLPEESGLNLKVHGTRVEFNIDLRP